MVCGRFGTTDGIFSKNIKINVLMVKSKNFLNKNIINITQKYHFYWVKEVLNGLLDC
jgi:hypothetical protein